MIAGTCSLAVIGARRTAAIAAEEATEPDLVDFAEIDPDSAANVPGASHPNWRRSQSSRSESS